MKNMTDKTKKRFVIAGGLAISAVLVILIAGAFKTPTTDDVDISNSRSESQSVVAETPDTTEKENDIKVPDIEIPQETENPNGDECINQTIQPAAVNPKALWWKHPIPQKKKMTLRFPTLKFQRIQKIQMAMTRAPTKPFNPTFPKNQPTPRKNSRTPIKSQAEKK